VRKLAGICNTATSAAKQAMHEVESALKQFQPTTPKHKSAILEPRHATSSKVRRPDRTPAQCLGTSGCALRSQWSVRSV
jgi:hypothetical protein